MFGWSARSKSSGRATELTPAPDASIHSSMTEPIPSRIPTVTLDFAVYCLSTLFIPELQLVVDLDSRLDADRLRRALRLLYDAEPVLGCRFVVDRKRPYWERLDAADLDRTDLLQVIEVESPHDDRCTEPFLSRFTDGIAGPQAQVLVLRGADADRLLLKVNHYPADAGATKQVGYRLAGIYRALGDDPGFRPEPNTSCRSLQQVFDQVPGSAKPRLLARAARTHWRNSFPAKSMVLLGKEDRSGEVVFALHHFNAARVAELREASRARGATLNDLFVAATMRVVARKTEWDGRRALRLTTTVDLRRHLPEGTDPGICNLSAFTYPNLGRSLGDSFDDTLVAVKKFMDELKAFHIGVELPALIQTMTGLFSFERIHRDTTRSFWQKTRNESFPQPFTNMGPIRLDRLGLGDVRALGAYMIAPPTFPPGLAFGVSGDGARMTLSSGFYNSSFDPHEVAEVFDLIDRELPDGA